MAKGTMEDFLRMLATGVAIALFGLWLANNVQEIGRLVAPRGSQTNVLPQ